MGLPLMEDDDDDDEEDVLPLLRGALPVGYAPNTAEESPWRSKMRTEDGDG